MVDWQLRLRAALEKQFLTILVVLIIIALLGGWMTYSAYAAPDPTTEQQVTAWEVTGNFSHNATVTADNSLYAQGTTLTDRPAYFMRLSPELDGTFHTSYDARDNGELDQTVSLSLIMQNVEQDGDTDDPTVYWQQTEPLDSQTAESVIPREQVHVSFSQNMSDIETEKDRINDELGSSPGETETLIRATVRSQGTINGEKVNETDTFFMPITFHGESYSVGGPDPTIESYETTNSVTADRPAGPLQRIGGPLLLVTSVGLIGALAVSNRQQLSEAERAQIAYEHDRDTFDEWISTITLPDEVFDLPQAEAESLGELVDFAIDTDNGVIKDPDTEGYYVKHDGYLYTYQPTPSMTELSTEPSTVDEDSKASESDATENSNE